MGSGRTRSTTPDLFSTESARVPSPPSVNSPPPMVAGGGAAIALPSFALPTNLSARAALIHADALRIMRCLSLFRREYFLTIDLVNQMLAT